MARRLPLAGAAVAGAVVGHGLAYALAVPEPGRRLAVLAGSGHAYWSAAIAAAIVLGLVSLGATLALDTEIRFRSVAERAAFTSDLADAVTTLVSRYHDAKAPGGRSHRLVVVAHPLPAAPSPDPEEAP